MPPPQRETGPTPPMSTSSPTPEELAMSKVFEQHIEKTKESLEAARQREIALAWLDQQVKTWVTGVAISQGIRESDARTLGGRIFTFGSYRLGVHGPGADIDTLVVAPRHCQKADFFGAFVDMLSEHKDRVTDVVPVPDAATPVLKVKISGIHMDILFASIGIRVVPDSFRPTDDDVLCGVDESTQRSLNGTRVATKLLCCVPDTAVFRTVLRGIKKWAQARGVYGNVYGYPGGVAWAIMVARVCQLYPHAAPGTVFCKFFKFYASWWKERPSYPQDLNNPIFLTSSLDVDLNYGFRVWNRNLWTSDRYDVLPIITPCYPFMNTCYNTTLVTLGVMCEEIQRASVMIEGMLQQGGGVDFDKLWEPSDFFSRYASFLVIKVAGTSPDVARRWAGFAESRLRRLLSQLAIIPCVKSHIWPKDIEREFTSQLTGQTRFEHSWFIGLDADSNAQAQQTSRRSVSLDNAWLTFVSYVSGPFAQKAQNPFVRDPRMLDPEQQIVLRKDLEALCPYALTDADRAALERVRKEAKETRKRKRREAKEAAEKAAAEAAAKAAAEAESEKAVEDGTAAPSSPEQPAKRPRLEEGETAEPPPADQGPGSAAGSPQQEAAAAPGTPTADPEPDAGGPAAAGKQKQRTQGHWNRRSLTDELILDCFQLS